MKRHILILLCVLLAVPPLALAQSEVRRRVDVLTLRFLLANDLLAELERRMQGYQRALEADIRAERDMELALEAFAIFDPHMESQLKRWIMHYPSSAVALAARAKYNLASAWRSRGTALASNTSDQRMKQMSSYLDRVVPDCDQALKLNPNMTVCYDYLMTVFGMAGAREYLNNVGIKGLERAPASMAIRTTYMWALLPQWGGSFEQMQAWATESQKYVSVNPELRTLQGYAAVEQGRILAASGKSRQALQAFGIAESFGGRRGLYRERADLQYEMGELRNALADCEKGLEFAWQDVELLKLKAKVLREMGRRSEAGTVENFARVLSTPIAPVRGSHAFSTRQPSATQHPVLNQDSLSLAGDSLEGPMDTAGTDVDPMMQQVSREGQVTANDSGTVEPPSTAAEFVDRARRYLLQRDYAAARRDLDSVIALNPSDPTAHYSLGWIHLHHGMYERGIELNTEAIRLNREFGVAYLNRSFGFRMLGRMEEAGRDLTRACELGVAQACALLKTPVEKAEDDSGTSVEGERSPG